MPKFFITDYDLTVGNKAYILGEDARYIRKLPRIKNGENIIVCDGKGSDFIAKVEKMENDAILIEIIENFHTNGEPQLEVNLYMALLKGEDFEYAIQKCVEAGVCSIIPLITKRTVVNIADSKIDRKYERWNRISTEAAKQSGRSRIPKVSFPVCFDKALEKPEAGALSLICYTEENSLSLKKLLGKNKNPGVINVFIGPEGGFTPKEQEMAVKKGLESVTLGKRILKAETTGLFVTAATMYEYGELDIKA